MASVISAQRRILSGIQPTGMPTLGNYLGALRQWAANQGDTTTQAFYSLVDLHAMTVPYEPQQLREQTQCVMTSRFDCLLAACSLAIPCMLVSRSSKRSASAAMLLACGIDPSRSALFRQSAVRMPQCRWRPARARAPFPCHATPLRRFRTTLSCVGTLPPSPLCSGCNA